MALFQINVFSHALMMNQPVTVLLPEVANWNDDKVSALKDLPTLYLLHGYSDDSTKWLRMTSIERYASEYRLAVVMPSALHSCYTDMAIGDNNYAEYVSRELPAMMESYFPLSKKREDRFVAGLSMGGYGTLRTALANPDRYAAAAAFSALVDPLEAKGKVSFDNAFGDMTKFKGSKNDLYSMAEKLTKETAPKLFIACGLQDSLYSQNEKFAETFGKKLDIRFDSDNGSHTWDMWDMYISRALKWLPLPENSK
ncbi:MAG: alpha/beta hydrolase family protein [Eubacteriales bacterium]|nr:alpha/beta hydrolase family protein [Eubacteriales bacterium]MDD3883286.1 alpha/beta hydrolase family protein [Eubacteriales bacterium]MDD4513922.1 alpha/beta hydrolase family protein [Eubacteriales bacterium]